jgi:hypothetical protein
MRARRGAAFTLVILALALGAAACGGKPAKTTTAQARAARAAEARFSAGLGRWHHSMLEALNGLSELFASEAGLVAIETLHSGAATRLARYESTLTNCAVSLHQIGPVPDAYELSGRYAGQACANLERGERLVEQAVTGLEHNTIADPLDPLIMATTPLGDGQAELTTAMKALHLPPALVTAQR